MELPRLLLEEEPRAGNPMNQRQRTDPNRTIFVDYLRTIGHDGFEPDGKGQLPAKEIELRTENLLGLRVGMNHQLARTSQQRQRRNHTDKPEAVVAMQVTQEDMPQTGKLQVHAAELDLRPFAAVDHKQVVAKVEHLRTGVVPQGRQGRAASQNIDFKFSHNF